MNDEEFLFELPPANLKVAEKRFKERNPIWTGCKAKLIERYLNEPCQLAYCPDQTWNILTEGRLPRQTIKSGQTQKRGGGMKI